MAAKKRTTNTKPRPVKKTKDNTLFITAGIIFCILLALLVYRKVYTPKIIEIFACSDYCPGPQEQYEVSAFEGISNKLQCQLIGGKPATITGWNTKNVCLVQ